MKNLLSNETTINSNNDTKPSFLAKMITGSYRLADRATAAALVEAKMIDAHISVEITKRAAEKKVQAADTARRIKLIETFGIEQATKILAALNG